MCHGIRLFRRCARTGLLPGGIAKHENGIHSQALPRLYIREGVSNDSAIVRAGLRKFPERLLKKADLRLAAVALSVIMRTIVDRIQARAMPRQIFFHLAVNFLKFALAKKAQRDSPLVRNQDDGQVGPVHASDRFNSSGKPFKLRPIGYVCAFRHFAIQHAIAVQKNIAYRLRIQWPHGFRIKPRLHSARNSVLIAVRFEGKGLFLNDIIWAHSNPIMDNLHEVMELIEHGWSRVHAIVVGDVMLDRYIWGKVERISPEAPVPVVHASHRSAQPGGAANVAMNLAGLGARVTLLGFAGGDSDQQTLEQLLQAAGVATRLTETSGIPTTCKLRILSGSQQMLRLDTESRDPRPEDAYAELLGQFEEALPAAGIVILSDYAKGVLKDAICRPLIQKARGAGLAVMVDPKSRSFDHYRGATTICPNLNEIALATQETSGDMERILTAAQRMIPNLGIDYLTVTLSERGIAVLYPDRWTLLPAVTRNVYDVSGAGDTVIATLALGIAGGLPIETAGQLANIAAGIVIGKVGTVPIQRYELTGALSEEIGLHAEEKVLSLDHLLARASSWRSQSKRIVFTNGCFDILHIGHIALLAEARRQGDKLVVGINSDRSVQRLKGPARPMIGERERAQMLAALAAVDSVVIFDEETPLAIIEAIRPDVLVKGGDYTEAGIVGAPEVRGWGGIVKIIPTVEGFSTSKIIAKAIASSPA